eukprot:scaffold31692_cov68-Phaeocystis_antarctica.AAC.4
MTAPPRERTCERERACRAVPCRGVRARARGGGRAAGAVLAGPCLLRHTTRGAGLFWEVSGVYWLRGMGVHVGVACTVLRVGVWRVVCGVCAVWHECALKWRVACDFNSFVSIKDVRLYVGECVARIAEKMRDRIKTRERKNGRNGTQKSSTCTRRVYEQRSKGDGICGGRGGCATPRPSRPC